MAAFGEARVAAAAGAGDTAVHYATLDPLLADLRAALADGATVLVKGSRFMKMERVVQALTGQTAEAH